MTDPYAESSAANAGDQTIPLVPEDGFAEVTQRPFADETLIDPLANDPWASGPGLGASAERVSPASAQPAPHAPAPAAPTLPPAPPVAWPAPGTDSPSWGFPAPTAYQTTPAPEAQPRPITYPQPPTPPADQRPWADAYPEPSGPAGAIPAQAHAPSPYAGQQWPAVPEPHREYGYGFDTATDHPNAIPALVTGIIGLVLFSPLAPVAWYLGAKGQREARLDPGRWRSGGTLAVGKVLGIIGTVILAAVTVFIFLAILAIVAFGA